MLTQTLPNALHAPIRRTCSTEASRFCRSVALLLPALWLGCGAALFGAESLPPQVNIPAQDAILKTLRTPHPRLLATAEDFSSLKVRIASDTQLKEWQARLRREAQNLLSAPPSKYEIPDGLRLLATSRRVMNRVYTLALMHQLDGDKAYLDRAWEELEAAAAFPDWNPKHFLDTAEMTHAFAIAYDWLYHAWTPAQRETLRQAILKKGFEPARPIYAQKRGWSRARHNWNQVCNGGLGMGALALADTDPEVAAEILHSAAESIPLAMVEFAPDGAWNEGPGYWNYATVYNIVFLAGLQSALGTDFGLSNIPGFGQTGWYPIYITGPLGRTFNYADGGDHGVRGSQIFWLARRFKQPVLSWYQNQTTSPGALDLLWQDSKGVTPKTADLGLDRYFRAAEVVTMRSSWEDKDALFLGFKAGDNKANHSHLDLGCFVFDALGVRWAVDLGADNYNLPGYFGKQRWDYYRLRAEGQNTIVINPGNSPDQDPSAATRIVEYMSTPARAIAVADLTPAYRTHASRVMRGMMMLDRSRLLIQDEVKAAKPVDAWWFMHTTAAVEIGADGRTAVLSEKGAKLKAQILGAGATRFEVLEAKPLPSSPQPAKQAENKGIRKLAVYLQQVSDATLSILLTPQTGKDFAPVQHQPLAAW